MHSFERSVIRFSVVPGYGSVRMRHERDCVGVTGPLGLRFGNMHSVLDYYD